MYIPLHESHKDLLQAITNNGVYRTHGLHVEASKSLTDDPSADHLDALLCAIQAAWAWTQRDNDFGAPHPANPLEDWIADPSTTGTLLTTAPQHSHATTRRV
jgi:hypothetical protein